MVKVIAETPRWLVLDKPAGWLTIPGRPAQSGALPSASDEAGESVAAGPPVLSEWAERNFGRIWVVHRLDLETSGVILFARDAESHQRANAWFRKHEVKKLYHAVALGLPSAPVFKLQQPIEGARCVTQIEVKERFVLDEPREGGFLAYVRPLTGRRHQIRIHLSGAGFPICGDLRYGGPRTVSVAGRGVEVSRVALHAARLELPAGEGVFEAEWPEDFRSWMERVRLPQRAGEGT